MIKYMIDIFYYDKLKKETVITQEIQYTKEILRYLYFIKYHKLSNSVTAKRGINKHIERLKDRHIDLRNILKKKQGK